MRDITPHSARVKLVLNIMVLLLASFSFSKQSYKKEEASLFHKIMVETFAPIQRGTMSIKETISSFIDHYFKIVDTRKENMQLKKHIANLENTIFGYTEIEKENLRLKELLDFGEQLERKKVLAQIVSWDSSNEFKVLRINKGSNDGLKLLSPVITAAGLVGYVYKVTANYSDILTILDQNNRVDAIVTRTRSHGIVEGVSQFTCRLKYVGRSEPVEIGDEVISAGLGAIYPKGIKIGTVKDIDKASYGITQNIEITPSVDFHRLEEVVVLVEKEL